MAFNNVINKLTPSGDILGTTDTQTITNKTIDGSLNTITNIDLSSDVTGLLPVGGINATGTPDGTTFLRGDGTWSTPVGAGDMDSTTYDPANIAEQLVGLTATQTLSGKTIDASSNTISNLDVADFDAAAIVTLAETIVANNNDTTIPTSAAVKAYADSLLGVNDAMTYEGAIDASSNPNYPAADAGHTYKISVAGKIGGASGPNVEVGDMIIATVDGTASGNHATVGANWTIIQSNLDGAVIGPTSSVNDRISTFDGTSGKLIKDSGQTISGVLSRANHSGTQLLSTISDAGTIASQNANSVNITGGSISGITDLAVLDGGTGASTAIGARTNLGLVIGTDVQAWNTNLDTWATKTAPSGTVVGTTDTQTLTNKTLTTPTIGSFTNATHNHTNAAGGGQLDINSATTGTLGETRGGTGQSTIAVGDILLGNGVNTIGKLTIGSSNKILTSNGTTASWEDRNSSLLAVEHTSDATVSPNVLNIANKAGTICVLTLPATYAVGDVFSFVAKGATGFRIDQNGAAHKIHLGNVSSTTGTGGYVDNTVQFDAIELVAVTANGALVAKNAVGTFDLQ